MNKLLSKKWQREHGVALLMTLAILAMLMILAMSFAFTATHEKQAAVIHSDLVRARMLTESALNRAISVIRDDLGTAYPASQGFYRVQSGGNANRYVIGSIDPSSGTDVDTPLAQSLSTSLDGKTFFYNFTQNLTAAGDTTLAQKLNWELVGGTGSDSVIGRFGYIIIDESGKLPINAYIDPGQAEQSEDRSGLTDTEVFLGDALTTAAVIGPFGSAVPNTNRWLSWSNLLRSDIVPLNTEQKRQEAYESLFPHGYDIEAFHDAGTDYHRFNLGQGEDFWGDATVDSLLAADKAFWSGSDVSTDSVGGIHWLSSPATTDQIRQVAANIIDYSDQDSTGTTDYVSPTGSTATYFGNERVPYLNEMYFNIHKVTVGSPSTSVNVYVELVNIYDTAMTVDVTLHVNYTVSGSSESRTHTFNGITVPANDYAGSGVQTAVLKNGNSDETVGILNITAEVTMAGGDLVDVVWINMEEDGAEFSNDPGTVGLTALQTDFITVYQVQDPRSNLRNTSADENWVLDSEHSLIPLLTGDIGSQNSIADSDPSPVVPSPTTMDTETVSDPAAGLSTAYIPDSPMETLWELGAIHRGVRWQTVNLHAYTAGTGFSTTYADGDAGMLEYVKVGDRTIHNGGFNINSVYEPAWDAIVNVKLEGSYDNPDNGGLTAEPSATLASAVATSNRTAPLGTNRGALMSIAEMTNDGDQDNDRKEEEVIGKIAHLLSVRPNYFTVIAVSQSLRDLDEIDAGVVTQLRAQYGTDDIVRYATGPDRYARVLSEHATLAVVYRDALTDDVRIVHTEELY